MTHKVLTDNNFVKLIHSTYVFTRLRKEINTERNVVSKHRGEAVSQEIHKPPYGQCTVFGQGICIVLIPRAILVFDVGIKEEKSTGKSAEWSNLWFSASFPSYLYNSKHTL